MSRPIAEHVWGVIGGVTMILDVFITYQIWFIYQPTLLVYCSSISRPAWISLDQFITWWRCQARSENHDDS